MSARRAAEPGEAGGRRFAAVLLGALALLAPTVRARNMSDCGGSSRLATAESLVERGSFAIDDSSLSYTCDQLEQDGRRYSDKPPLLSVAAAGLYALLHHGFGLSFNPAADPGRNTLKSPTYYLMVLLVSALSAALVAALVDRELRRAGLASLAALAGAGLAVFGTLLWPLSTLFTNHTVAAALLFAGFVQGLNRAPEARRAAVSGLLLGALFAVDLPLGAAAILLVGARFAFRGSRAVLSYGAGLVPCVLLHFALNIAIVGDLSPPQTHRELYNEETGHIGESASGFERVRPAGFYVARNLVGAIGLLSLTPVLIPCLGAAAWLARRGSLALLARASLALGAALGALYCLVYPEVVGCSYGMRHLAPLEPVWVCLGLLAARGAGAPLRRAIVATGLVSIILAGGGVLIPTTCAGFETKARALIPARVFATAVEEGILARIERWRGRSDGAAPRP